MGACQSTPPSLRIGACNSQGKRDYNEDRFSMFYPLPGFPNTAFFGVYDGHSGNKAANFCKDEFHKYLWKHASSLSRPAIRAAFLKADEDFLTSVSDTMSPDGCTVVIAAVTNGKLVVANAGDSRCVLSKANKASQLSIDHKPSDQDELERLQAMGIQIQNKYIRSDKSTSMIAVSRALGDVEFKQGKDPEKRILSCIPHISIEHLTDDHQFCILATDGLWDVVDNQTAVDFVLEHIRLGVTVPQIARQLVKKALRRKSGDNITVVIVVFPHAALDGFVVREASGGAEASYSASGASGSDSGSYEGDTYYTPVSGSKSKSESE